MVEATTGFKTKYGSVWPTEEQANIAEAEEEQTAFIEEFTRSCYYGHDAFSFENNQKAAQVIIKNKVLIQRLYSEYDI